MENMTSSGFGDLLKSLRKRRRLTQKELATRLGVHRNTIGTWENGDFLPMSKTIVLELAQQLKLDTDDTRRLLEASLTALSPHWHVPYQRNPFFIGREEVLQHLYDTLASKHTAVLSQSYALSGLGGIGKTQTAIEYAYRYANEYAAVFWVGAETMESIVSSMVAIATLLDLPEKQEQKQDKVVAAVIRWLNNHSDWLLIFDNVEDLVLVKDVIPTARSGSLLFTSRKQALGIPTQILSLAPMDMEEGLRFLLRRVRYDGLTFMEQISKEDQESARGIVTAMDGLPLALDQAGAYIEETKCSLSDYLQLFQNSHLRLLDEREMHADHPLSVTKTFALAFEQLEKSSPNAAELLTVCAFLSPEAIPEMFFLQGAAQLGSTFEVLAADLFTFNTAIKTLLSYSLFQRNAATHTITIHRLVQAVLKEHLPSTTQRIWIKRVILTTIQLFPTDWERQTDYWQIGEQLLSHALIGISLSEQWDEDKVLRITLMKCVATYLVYRARYIEAEVLLQKALHISEQALGQERPLIVELLYELAVLRKAQGMYEESINLLERVIDMGEEILDIKHSFVMKALHQLATIYREQGEYDKAESFFQRALHLGEQKMGPTHPQVASILDNLAILYAQQGKYAAAEPLFQRALQIKEHTEEPNHLMITFPLINLAILYAQQGKYEEAEPMLQRALHIREQVLGPEHPELAFPLTNLALIYIQQGKYKETEPLLQRALHIREQMLGSEHLQVAFTLESLADLYLEQAQYEQAEALYKRTLDIREKGLRLDHHQVASPLYGLAEIYRKRREYEKAEVAYKRALHIREKVLGQEHDEIAQVLTGLATLLSEQGQYEEAELLYQRALMMRQRILGPQHPNVADTLYYFAHFYQMQQQNSEALSRYQQALTIRERAFGIQHPKTIVTRIAYTQLQQEST